MRTWLESRERGGGLLVYEDSYVLWSNCGSCGLWYSGVDTNEYLQRVGP